MMILKITRSYFFFNLYGIFDQKSVHLKLNLFKVHEFLIAQSNFLKDTNVLTEVITKNKI